jgi:pentatricopeptide repeat protein
MQHESGQPVPETFVGMLNACANIIALEEGRCSREQIIQSCCASAAFVENSLVDMYAKCGSMEDAKRVFNKLPSCDFISWNSMILVHVKCGQGQKALELFQQIQHKGVWSDPVTYVGMINACASVDALEEGRHVHEQIIQSRCESDVFVGSSLIDM